MLKTIFDLLLRTVIGAFFIIVLSLLIFLLFVKGEIGMKYIQTRVTRLDAWLFKKWGIGLWFLFLILVAIPFLFFNCYQLGTLLLDTLGWL